MSRKTALAAALAAGLTLGVALPAAAATPAVAVAVAQDPVITEADVEARAEIFGAAMETLAVELEGIRADVSLSDAEKDARMDALIATKQPEIDAFADYLAAFVRQQAAAEGASPEEAEAAVGMIRSMFATQLVAALKSGDFSSMGG
ncbi:MAG: hypothetical protein KJ676_03580 [Alphaproteobacteria bacterium]|nr:hypothetical protein [Alphaproteobacteria bacterium]MBU1526482.1 hypothetical protein [Alphaproteobacteria bacterium]MBU2116746.1 hypothetical protein [Alphaproteobacteria bacterium]MBU2350300.1 hypothetical protein [Alphaproteobacteria bacterium]MBU2382512.1 hypothetical protein [Alphaproteobacteria bacterium]